MTRIVIIGAGGHAQVIADVLLKQHTGAHLVHPIGYLDDDPARRGELLIGLPVIGELDLLFNGKLKFDQAVIAIGDNATRREIATQMASRNIPPATAIHPAATVAHDVQIEPGSMICAGAVINPGTRIGHHVIINTGATVDHHNQIGDFVHLAPGTHTGGDVTIQEGAFIGMGAVVLPRQKVGAWATVGGGAVVRTGVPPHQTVVGIPARPISR